MDPQLIAFLVFILFLGIFLIKKRKSVKIQSLVPYFLYVIMYRTKKGLGIIEKLSKNRRLLKIIQPISITIGFAGMLLVAYFLIFNIFKSLTGVSQPGVAVVLPFRAKGVFYVPFLYWIISIFILAVVHEFSHGIYSRFHKVKLKSTGFAFLSLIVPILPAAFVEPDEKQLNKKKLNQKLSILSAGPFSNIVLAFIVLGIIALVAVPISKNVIDYNGVKIVSFGQGPAKEYLHQGDTIEKIDNSTIKTIQDFVGTMRTKKPNQTITLLTDKAEYNITLSKNPKNKSMAFLGVSVTQNKKIKPEFEKRYGVFIPQAILWFFGLLYWLYLLNLGIGLFNLVPIGPIDGGRMVYYLIEHKTKNKQRANKIFSLISSFFLLILFINIFLSFL